MMKPNWVFGRLPAMLSSWRTSSITWIISVKIAGNAHHIAIGSDLDGGYGTEQCRPIWILLPTFRSSPKFFPPGYSHDQVADVMHGNWLRFFEAALPLDGVREFAGVEL